MLRVLVVVTVKLPYTIGKYNFRVELNPFIVLVELPETHRDRLISKQVDFGGELRRLGGWLGNSLEGYYGTVLTTYDQNKSAG